MNPDYEVNFHRPCPHCGHEATHSRDCDECHGEGEIDDFEDDPLWFEPGDVSRCRACRSTGVLMWCPHCDLDPRRALSKGKTNE